MRKLFGRITFTLLTLSFATVAAHAQTTVQVIRVNNLGCIEALLNVLINGWEIAAILFGFILLLRAFRQMSSSQRLRTIIIALLPITSGLLAPGVANWIITFARDANLFT